MNQPDDKLQIAFGAALMTFCFGVVSLLLREWLERFRENQNRTDELRLLIDLYLAEIVAGTEKCAQYVRQICLHEMSRSQLPLLIGASKLDRAATLGADPDVLKSLHDIYRLFDLVQNQVGKATPDDFRAIYSFIITEMNDFPPAVQRVIGYVRDLHGTRNEVAGRRLLGRVKDRLLGEFVFGIPKKPLRGYPRRDVDALERRFKEYIAEINDWVISKASAIALWSVPESEIRGQIEIAKMSSVKTRCKMLRLLTRYLEMEVEAGADPGQTIINRQVPISAGYAIVDLPEPDDWTTVTSLLVKMKPWEEFLLQNDHQPWDV